MKIIVQKKNEFRNFILLIYKYLYIFLKLNRKLNINIEILNNI